MLNGKSGEVQAEFMVGEQSSAVFNFSTVAEGLLPSQTLSSPIPASSRVPALAVPWVFTSFAVFAPMLLVTYAFLALVDDIERAQIIVQGMESIAFILVVALAARAFNPGWVSGARSRLEGESALPNRAALA